MTEFNILKIILLFLIPANIVLLLLLRKKINKTIGDYVSLVFSYGVGPLFNGLFFYYLVWFFPEKTGLFYVGAVSALWVLLLAAGTKKIKFLALFYKKIFSCIKKGLANSRKLFLFAPVLAVLLFTATQALFYPIVDNDQAIYLNQSEALYQYRNLDWQREDRVVIRGDDEYKYNSAIQPAIPSLMAFSFMIHKEEGNYFVFNFFMAYYYLFLLAFFLFVIYKISATLDKNPFYAILFGSFFFVFSWGLSRTFIFNSKESVIYFLTAVGIYLVYLIAVSSRRHLGMEALLGIVLGLNSLVNLHGIIIEAISLLVLFMVSSQKIKDRFLQVLWAFSVSLFAGGFEIIETFGFVFWSTAKNISDSAIHLVHEVLSPKDGVTAIKNSMGNPRNTSVANLDATHSDLYQVKGFLDIYLKGKLQIFTNIGIFGFYAWIFIATLAYDLKNIWKNKIAKILVLFIGIYFVVVIDPFNLNGNQYAIVLWGSSKYAKLLLLLSLAITSVYAYYLLSGAFGFFSRYGKAVSIAILSTLFIFVLLRNEVIAYLLKVLFSVTQVYKGAGFYHHKIEIFFYSSVLIMFLVAISFALDKVKREMSFIIFSLSCISFFIFVPFFITDVGKVSLLKTFPLLGADGEKKLEKSLTYGDIYNVYFYAKNNLPCGTLLQTSFNEIYTYDDHFQIKKGYSDNVDYGISPRCKDNYKPVYTSGNVSLCAKND